MKATGNGRPELCAANLLRITRGEVPYERLKGLDARLIDRPGKTGAEDAGADIAWTLKAYEPRADLDDADIRALLADEGHYGINIGLTVTD